MSTEVALISIWQDGHRWWREDQVLAMMESVGVKSYQQAREDAAQEVHDALFDPTGSSTQAVDDAWPAELKPLIEQGAAWAVEAAIANIAVAAARGDGSHE